MWTSLTIANACCSGDCGDATAANQQTILSRIDDLESLITSGSGGGSATIENQRAILESLTEPKID